MLGLSKYGIIFGKLKFQISFIKFSSLFSIHPATHTELMQRSIYTAEQLSVQKYLHDRKQLNMTMHKSSIETKKTQLYKYLQSSSQSIPPWSLANDFIQFLYLIDNTDVDFVLLENLMDKFKMIDVKNLRNKYVGSILMKMLHHFKRDASAQKVQTIVVIFYSSFIPLFYFFFFFFLD